MNNQYPKYSHNLPDCNITGEIYPLLEAALLWCGVTKEDLSLAMKDCRHVGRGIYINPYISCLEKKTRAILFSVNNNELRTCREHGEGGEVGDHVAYDRRHFWASDLKIYIEKYHPDDKPSFLFNKPEMQPALDLAAYNKLQLEVTNLQVKLASAESAARDEKQKALLCEEAKQNSEERLEKAKEIFKEQKAKIEQLSNEIQNLNAEINLLKQQPDDRKTLFNIIAALKQTLIDKGVFENQAALITFLNEECEGYGLSDSNLRNKFAEINRQQKSN